MGERWDRDRFMYERSRDQSRDQSRAEDERTYMRGGRGSFDRSDDRQDRRVNRDFDDDDMVRDRRYYPEDRPMPRREGPGPEYPRRGVMERERERDTPPRDAAPRRPGFLRRQSSLDTFDRRPSRIFHEHDELPPPARREDVRRDDYRAPAYTPIPLPKARGLPPPRRYPDQGFYDDIKVAEPDHYGDDDFRPYPDRVREREYSRTTRTQRSHSRDSLSTRTRSHRSSSISSSTSSHSSSSSGGTTVRSEYPKKGKTRIPSKLVSKRALIDLGYPFFEEGNTIIVQKALGQDNIDELLKVSEDYKKVELDILAARNPPAPVAALPPPPPSKAPAPPPPPPVFETPAPPPDPRPAPPPEPKKERAFPPPPPVVVAVPPPPPPPPVIIDAGPPVELVEETYIRDESPSRSSSTSSWDTHRHRHSSRRRRKSVGPLAIYERSRSRSRSGHELRAEIRALERELAHRPKGSSNRELVRAERLPDGQVVIYEEKLEKVVEHHKPPRLEKDKKGPPPSLVRAMLKTLT